jgi:hypothetical protein
MTGVPASLVTYDDLAASSPLGGTYADRAVIRMMDTAAPMPPAPAAPISATDQTVFADWVNAGMPMGDCGGDPGAVVPSPYDTPEVCTSNQSWTLGDAENPNMHPGRACLGCHGGGGEEAEEAPMLVGGTVYPTAHEPDECYGQNGTDGTKVVIVDANKKSVTLDVVTSGNFSFEGFAGALSFPITAKVVRGAAERVMTEPVADGDCNACHTLNGSGNPAAPGRIMAP